MNAKRMSLKLKPGSGQRAKGTKAMIDHAEHHQSMCTIASVPGALEAADLVHSSVATRVAIFISTKDPAGDEFIRRGVPYEDEAARSVRQLGSLGVETIDQIPGSVIGTEAKVRCLPAGVTSKGSAQSSLCLLTTTRDVSPPSASPFLERSSDESHGSHCVRALPHFEPDRWCESRGGVRAEIEEVGKLLLDVMRHPISR